MIETQQPEAIDPDDAAILACFGIGRGEWAAIKRDVTEGARRFWMKRGVPEPDGAWGGFYDLKVRRGRRAAEQERTTNEDNDGK